MLVVPQTPRFKIGWTFERLGLLPKFILGTDVPIRKVHVGLVQDVLYVLGVVALGHQVAKRTLDGEELTHHGAGRHAPYDFVDRLSEYIDELDVLSLLGPLPLERAHSAEVDWLAAQGAPSPGTLEHPRLDAAVTERVTAHERAPRRVLETDGTLHAIVSEVNLLKRHAPCVDMASTLVRTVQLPRTYWTIHTKPNHAFSLRFHEGQRTGMMGFGRREDALLVGTMIETHVLTRKAWPEMDHGQDALWLPAPESKNLSMLYLCTWSYDDIKLLCTRNMLDLIAIDKIVTKGRGQG
jgi:hypothetical protein